MIHANPTPIIREQERTESPLDYMLRVMRDETADERRRDEMAKAAAPYLHPKPQSIRQSIKAEFSISDRLERALARTGMTGLV